MNEQIKFRCWDSFYKQMIFSEDREFANLGEFFNELNERSKSENDPIVMQNTGLKDKHGKELYEGDKIKYSFIKVSPNGAYRDFGSATINSVIDYDFMHSLKQLDEFEIIGNIFEQLKDKKGAE